MCRRASNNQVRILVFKNACGILHLHLTFRTDLDSDWLLCWIWFATTSSVVRGVKKRLVISFAAFRVSRLRQLQILWGSGTTVFKSQQVKWSGCNSLVVSLRKNVDVWAFCWKKNNNSTTTLRMSANITTTYPHVLSATGDNMADDLLTLVFTRNEKIVKATLTFWLLSLLSNYSYVII